jgi:hypothetical protein
MDIPRESGVGVLHYSTAQLHHAVFALKMEPAPHQRDRSWKLGLDEWAG